MTDNQQHVTFVFISSGTRLLNHIRIIANLLGKEQNLSVEHEDTGDEARQIEVPRLLSVLENESIVAAVF